MPSHDNEFYIFVFTERSSESLSELRSPRVDKVSEVCQDAIFETCSEFIYMFDNVKVVHDRRVKSAAAPDMASVRSVKILARSISSCIQACQVNIEDSHPDIVQLRTQCAQAQKSVSEISDLIKPFFGVIFPPVVPRTIRLPDDDFEQNDATRISFTRRGGWIGSMIPEGRLGKLKIVNDFRKDE